MLCQQSIPKLDKQSKLPTVWLPLPLSEWIQTLLLLSYGFDLESPAWIWILFQHISWAITCEIWGSLWYWYLLEANCKSVGNIRHDGIRKYSNIMWISPNMATVFLPLKLFHLGTIWLTSDTSLLQQLLQRKLTAFLMLLLETWIQTNMWQYCWTHRWSFLVLKLMVIDGYWWYHKYNKIIPYWHPLSPM